MPALVPAAVRTLAIFEIFAKEKRDLTNAELAKFLGVAESSCSDLVNTLIDQGYLKRSQISRTLYPTGRLHAMSSEINKNDDKTQKLMDICNALRDYTGESALCGILHHKSKIITVLAFAAGRDPLRYTLNQGDRISLHVSSIGKAILTKLPEKQIKVELGNKNYEKLASNTLTTPDELFQQVKEFRSKGWVYVENEESEGLASIAISGLVNGEVLAFSITGAERRIKQNQQDYLVALKKYCQEVFDES